MKVEKINESLYLTNVDSSAQASDVKKEAMFAAEFNSDDGIQLEKHSETQDNTPKTYTKKSKDADGNDVILTYRSKDDSLISREIKYSYGDTRTEFIKAGTSIVEKAEEKMLKATFEEFYSEKYEKEIKKIQKKNKKLEKENEQHKKEKEKTILTMYENGLSVELIAKYTNNNQNEIENIINKGGCN